MDMEEGAANQGDALLVEEGGVAAAISANAVDGLEEPPPVMTVEEGKKMTRSQRFWNRIVITTASACIAFAIASIALEMSTVVYIAFCISLVTAPYAIYQRKQLNKLPTMVHVINQTRHQVNRLSVQNVKFSHENDRLSGELADLKKTEFTLYQVCQQQEINVDSFRKLISENGEIQKEMKKILDAQQIQDIMTSILMSDTNQDFKLTEREIDRLMLRLKGYSVVDQERLKDTLRLWIHKSDEEEWKKLEEEAEGGTMTGVRGWVL